MTRNVRLEPLLPWPASPHGNRVCLQHHAYVLFYFPQRAWMPRMLCIDHNIYFHTIFTCCANTNPPWVHSTKPSIKPEHLYVPSLMNTETPKMPIFCNDSAGDLQLCGSKLLPHRTPPKHETQRMRGASKLGVNQCEMKLRCLKEVSRGC